MKNNWIRFLAGALVSVMLVGCVCPHRRHEGR